jgi:ZIP family zinc transporter
MSEGEILLLGFIAGATIFLGLPVGRMRGLSDRTRQFLNALAIGILIFLLWDVLSHAFEPVDTALTDLHNGDGGFGPVLGYGLVFFGGLAVGLLSLVYYERWLDRRKARLATGPGALAARGADRQPDHMMDTVLDHTSGLSDAARLSLMIAIGIGLHNFGEGLAIGASAASGEISLATVLVIGFALHNATEGFGIVAPLAAAGEHPTWTFLLTMGVIGGGPTFVGTLVGSQVTNEALNVAFLTLAAGSILYVVIELLGVARKSSATKDIIYWGVLLGLLAGFLTDMVVTAGGA